jgi:hypothetical protein
MTPAEMPGPIKPGLVYDWQHSRVGELSINGAAPLPPESACQFEDTTKQHCGIYVSALPGGCWPRLERGADGLN